MTPPHGTREYLIFTYLPPYPNTRTFTNALWTRHESWSVVREWLPPTLKDYFHVYVPSRRHALRVARIVLSK